MEPPKISNVWAVVGLVLSVALNIFAGWIVYEQVIKPPDAELCAPTPIAKEK